MIPPCFYCDKDAKYTGPVQKVQEAYTIVDVCEDHFVYNEAS